MKCDEEIFRKTKILSVRIKTLIGIVLSSYDLQHVSTCIVWYIGNHLIFQKINVHDANEVNASKTMIFTERADHASHINEPYCFFFFFKFIFFFEPISFHEH